MMPAARRSGILVPLFSAPSTGSWGIGDIGDIGPLTAWLGGAGQRILQLLPLNEMAPGTQSPYSAMSAMAIDPIYIRMPAVPDFAAVGGEAALGVEACAALADVRRAERVEYARIRPIKEQALRAAFEHFLVREWQQGSARAQSFAAFVADQAWWLDDYALFRALHERHLGTAWTGWPEPLRARHPDALEAARQVLQPSIRFFQYAQWIGDGQWAEARAAARANGVQLFGDLPFLVDTHSADVWRHQARFRLDRSVGVPPDAFSATGQDWGMPPYDWDALRAADFDWLRDRARRSADLFDGYRVDHLVGFYRTYSRPRDGQGEPEFSPADEDAQQALGEAVLGIFREPGTEIVAEDLGVVPDFVRASLERLAVPGFRVFRWERLWNEPGQPFRDPAGYPPRSVATSGTHDTEPLRTWWDAADADERTAMAAVPSVVAAASGDDLLAAPFVPHVRDALLQALFGAGSDIVLCPIQDIFGWDDRINEPATVNDRNWSYRLPWPIDELGAQPEAAERQATLREWARRYRRL
ncbi:MAG: 4-alpha-glucanotransferase [Vicinamibacterales bacterium]